MGRQSIRGADRRRFLARVGSLAAVTAAAPFAGASVTLSGRERDREDRDDDHGDPRARQAFDVRLDAARFQEDQPRVSHRTNGDERRYPDFIGSFSKTLPHDALGIVDPAAYAAFQHAVATGEFDDFAAIPIGGVGKLVDPQAAFTFQMDGADSHHLPLRVPPAFASAEEAGEIAEVYWQALTRDVPFASYDIDPDIAAAAASLSTFSDFRGPKVAGKVTPGTIFRASAPGDLVGPYISQFLWKTIPFGPFSVTPKVRAGLAGVDYLTDYASWLGIQNGAAAAPFQIVDAGSARFINDNRSLAAFLRADFSAQAFLNAALMLLATPGALSPTNPYLPVTNQAGFVTFGGPEILDVVNHVANASLKACWFQKWAVHRRLRPEAFAGAIHNVKTGGMTAPVHAEILDSSVLTEVHNRFGTYLLPQAYPEGSPAHPSYPAGHAVFSGACATMLKAFFNEALALPSPVVADATGAALLPYAGTLTVGNELNKLAANIAIGRDAAGVHWRSDGVEGLNLGEAAAIALLQDMRGCYTETFAGFSLTKFDGTTITI
jgi:membrane-associated phospholipid phosphatase